MVIVIPMVEVAKMSTFASTVDDLNLDFSDRNWEIAQQNGRRFQFEFKLRDSESEGSEIESEPEECDMEDEYFFDHRLDFGSYIPKVIEPPSGSDTFQNGVKELVVTDPKVLNNSDPQGTQITGDLKTKDVITNDAKTNFDENRNEEKIKTDNGIRRASINGLTLDTLTTAVEKFSLAVSLVCTISVAF